MRKSSKKATAAIVSNVPAIIVSETAATPVALETVTGSEISGLILDNATGETVANNEAAPEAPAAETNEAPVATADARVLRAERVAADRKAVAALYADFESNRLSVPVKALSAFKLETSKAHPVARNPSPRQAAALCAGLTANAVALADGARFPRVFEINGVNSAIENGVLRDAIASGLITVSGASPEAEIIRIAKNGAAKIAGQIGATIVKRVNDHAAAIAALASEQAQA